MKIYHYDDKYAGKNGVNGVKELVSVMCIGCAGTITPAILLGLQMISWQLVLLIVAVTVMAGGFLLKRVSIIVRSSMSAIIESDGELFYLMITPNLRGSSIPSSVTAILAGPSAVYAENSINAEITATNLAQNDDVVLCFFKMFQDDEIKTNFDTVMYGKPVTVYELQDRDFNNDKKKFYHVKCLKNKKRNTAVWIPRVLPNFFE